MRMRTRKRDVLSKTHDVSAAALQDIAVDECMRAGEAEHGRRDLCRHEHLEVHVSVREEGVATGSREGEEGQAGEERDQEGRPEHRDDVLDAEPDGPRPGEPLTGSDDLAGTGRAPVAVEGPAEAEGVAGLGGVVVGGTGVGARAHERQA